MALLAQPITACSMLPAWCKLLGFSLGYGEGMVPIIFTILLKAGFCMLFAQA